MVIGNALLVHACCPQKTSTWDSKNEERQRNNKKINFKPSPSKEKSIVTPASGRGARVSACAGLINQLQRCRFDSRIACLENLDTAIIVGDWWTGVGDTTP